MNERLEKNQYENFQHDLREAEAKLKGTEIEKNFIINFKLVISSIKRLQKENPNIGPKELEEKLVSEFLDFFEPIFSLNGCYERYILNLCNTYLEKKPEKKEMLLKKIEEENITADNNRYYQINEGKFEVYLIRYLLGVFKKQESMKNKIYELFRESSFLDNYIEENKKITNAGMQSIKDKMKNMGMSKKEIEEVEKFIHILNGNFSELSLIEKKEKEQDIKNNLADFIVEIYTNLEKIGYIAIYEEKQRRNFKEKNFSEFVEGENLFDLKNKEKMLECSVDSLMILASFWVNRYEKALEGYANALFVTDEFNYTPDVMEGKEEAVWEDINRREIHDSFLKISMISARKKELFNKAVQELKDSRYIRSGKYTETDKGYVYATKNVIEYIKKRYGKNYEEYFSNSDIEYDISLIIGLYDFKENAYTQKNNAMKAIISALKLNPKNINIGIIIEDSQEIENTKRRNISRNFITIGMDTELNFPVRLHIHKNELIDFLREFDGNTIMPIYEGYEDFSDISAQIITPFSENQRKILRERLKLIPIGSEDRKFFEHIDFLRNNKKIPKHLQNEKGVLKKRYIDMNTGEILEKTANGYSNVNYDGR